MSYIDNYRYAGFEEAVNSRVEDMMKNTERGSIFIEFLIEKGYIPEEVIDTEDLGWWVETLAKDQGIGEEFYLHVEDDVRAEVGEVYSSWTF